MLDREAARGRLINRIELRARDYLVGEIGPSKWIRWGRLMGLVGAGAIHGYWSAQMVQWGTRHGVALLHLGIGTRFSTRLQSGHHGQECETAAANGRRLLLRDLRADW